MEFLRIQRDINSVGPEVVGFIGDFPLANSFLLSLVITVIIVLVAVFVIRRFRRVPGKTQNIFEVLYEQMIGMVEQITGSKELAENIFPVIGALFVYLGIANLIGIIPGVSNVTYNGVQAFRTPTSDYNVTGGLALAMIVLVQVASIRQWGALSYLGKFFKFKELIAGFRQGIKEGLLAFIEFLIGLLDIVSELAKIISLSFRLFGNMFAGEVLGVLVLSALAFLLPALWMSLNLLFSVVQAVVFGSLVAAYYTLAVKE